MYFETFYVLIEKIVYWLLMLNKLKFLITTKMTSMEISLTSCDPAYSKVRTMDKSFLRISQHQNVVPVDVQSILAPPSKKCTFFEMSPSMFPENISITKYP